MEPQFCNYLPDYTVSHPKIHCLIFAVIIVRDLTHKYLKSVSTIFLRICGSTAVCWALFLDLFTQSVGLLGRRISSWQGRYLHTQDNTNTE
jgi:hypothetical protein